MATRLPPLRRRRERKTPVDELFQPLLPFLKLSTGKKEDRNAEKMRFTSQTFFIFFRHCRRTRGSVGVTWEAAFQAKPSQEREETGRGNSPANSPLSLSSS